MMGPTGVADVTRRMAGIERRFAVPAAQFQAVYAAAAAAASVAGPTAPPSAAGSADSAGARLEGLSSVGAASTRGGLVGAGPPTGGFAGDWAQRLPAAGRAWAPSIERAALRAGVEPALLASLVWAESGFDPGAGSHAGAIGLAQLMPGTAAGLGVDPYDPQQNLEGGARYLADQLRRFGRPELALAAYNAGPSRVEAAGGIPAITETQTYVPRVMGYYEKLRGMR